MKISSEKISNDLAKIVRGDVWGDILHRAAYSSDVSIYQILPACVVVPRNVDDVAAVVNYARDNKIPIAPRGAGSGVAGESLCSGIMLDMRGHMNRILAIEDGGEKIVCEPGVVLDEINRRLAEYGRKIGPDPSSSNRAVIGGCVANDSTGAHWLKYGHMGNWLETVEVVLADGSVVEFTNDVGPQETEDQRIAVIARECMEVLQGKEQIIENALHRTKRNRSGYTIAGICHDGKVNLARLMAGSEGTLGIFTKVRLRTVPLPTVKALVEFKFDSLENMAKAVPAIVKSGASVCELMDRQLLDIARDALPQYRDLFAEKAQAVLLVEHDGDNTEQIEQKIEKTTAAVGQLSYASRIVVDQDQQKRLWTARKEAGPLLTRIRDSKKPVEIIEDVCIENDKLLDYIKGSKEIFAKYDVDLSFYGHAGDAELHLRPRLDLRKTTDLEKLRKIADEVFSLAWSLGGSISGEHADGLIRAGFVRAQYGDEYYQLLEAIKNIFDPAGIMNPGKILSCDDKIMTNNLRAQHEFEQERLKSDLKFSEGELEAELDQCNGCGACLSREEDLLMCPVYRALGEELGSSRAKANLLKFWATGDLQDKQFESDEFKKFLGLCINCKACSIQCPAGVDISTLIIAARTEYVRRKGLTITEFLLSKNRYLSKLGSLFAPVSNFMMNTGVFKWGLEKLTGLDRRRQIPAFTPKPFLEVGRKFLSENGPIAEPVDRVAYFVDTWANFNKPDLGMAVLEVLRHNNIEVILPQQRPVPLPAICYGDVKGAKKDLAFNVEYLAKAIRDGYRIICSEPSAALCLQKELKHFISGSDAELVSKNTFELMNYLLEMLRQGKLKSDTNKLSSDFVYHQPCHLLCLGTTASIEVLRELCDIEVKDLQAGCCGLAGTFGMQKKNHDLSEKIAGSLKSVLNELKAETVLTECGACGMQIRHLSGKKVLHPIEVIAQCYSRV